MTTKTKKGTYSSPDGSRKWEYIGAFCCTLVIFSCGSAIGWISPSLTILMGPDSPIPVSSSDASTLASLGTFGKMLVSPVAAAIVDKIGRKNTLLIAGTPLVVSWAMIIAAENVMTLHISRFMAGLTIGLAMCVCPMYLGEIATPKGRGALAIVMMVTFDLGMLFSFFIIPYLSVRMMAWVCMVLVITSLASLWFMPESPYFLAMVGENEEAEEVLKKLRGRTDVAEELELLVSSVHGETENQKSGSFKELLTVRSNRRGLIINILLLFSQCFGGYFVLMIYGKLIFTHFGSLIPDHLANDILAVVQLISTILTIFVVDRFGRKPLILFSGVISGLCCGIVGAFLFATEHMQMDMAKYAIIPFFAVFILTFAMNCGMFPIQCVLVSEVFPTSIKALASCCIAVAGGVIATVSTKMYLIIAITWGYGHSTLFLAFCFLTWSITFTVLRLTPETKGKTLAEIQKELAK